MSYVAIGGIYNFMPYSDPSGSGYIVTAMRERLAGLHFIGSSVGEESNNWWYSLSFIMEKYGIMVGILLIGVLALLFGKILTAGSIFVCTPQCHDFIREKKHTQKTA